MQFQTSSQIGNRGIHLSTAAVEVGFGDTKWAYRDATGALVRKSFPSLAPKFLDDALSNSHGTSRRDTYIIKVDDKLHEVGPDVGLVVSQSNSGRYLNDDFPNSSNYTALVLGAISQMTANNIDHLVLGLPVHTLERFTEYLKKHFTGTFNLADRQVTIKRVSVLAQPIGTLVRCVSEQMTIKSGINNLIIDPGYYSTDWVVADGFNMKPSRSDGKVAGVYPILNEVASLISKDLNIRFDQIERISRAIRENESLSILGRKYSNEEIWGFVEKSQQIINDCLSAIMTKIETINDIESVILTGGGSVFYKDACIKTFAPLPVVVLNNPAYANVIGYLLAGENSAKHHAK